MPLQGRTVLVTGASRGIGSAIALACARAGAHIGIGYRSNADAAQRTLDAVVELGGSATLHCFDVRDRAAVDAGVARFAAERGRLDVLVNNAGVAGDAFAFTMSVENWNRVLEVDLTGPFHCARAAAAAMMRSRSGCIINIASVAGVRASPGQANYSAAKGGLLAVTRTLAAELGRYGVRVNAVVPGMIAAGMVERMDPRVVARRTEQIPLGRLGRAEEVAGVVAFMASDAAAYITGQAIIVDGGWSM